VTQSTKNDLEFSQSSEHFPIMAKATTKISRSKLGKSGAKRTLGRSPATGMFILVPVTGKDSKITQTQANTAFDYAASKQ
jgi:hypothetical protein